MHIVEITWRNKNDFHFIAECKFCGKRSRHGDGYADYFYCERVFPDRQCKHCGLNEYGHAATPAETVHPSATIPQPQT